MQKSNTVKELERVFSCSESELVALAKRIIWQRDELVLICREFSVEIGLTRRKLASKHKSRV
ncbi:hypothetical protein HJC45_003104 [Shigella dysenteriae]|uniref:hypothetical protein n=1 Tax=Escherichia coli TaxID=562 RepID=UPI000DFED2D5|nr:hypothetical protein [Escherichia coli]EFP6908582.1 hypothetical protein [Shigella dysenteriae]EFL5719938.1 hypothetical protein [Escherichia coli]EFP7033402.1 hypothetical protein [Shigella dysenteriae]EFW3898085.1 hypothetical protein [Shigella dysenteriae]MCX3825174.1 hypothetical protein [Escherichia coli]